MTTENNVATQAGDEQAALSKQLTIWRADVARINDLIAHASGGQAGDEPMAWRYRLREKVGNTEDKWSVTDNALFVAKMGWAFEIEPLYVSPRATADVERDAIALLGEVVRLDGISLVATIDDGEVCTTGEFDRVTDDIRKYLATTKPGA